MRRHPSRWAAGLLAVVISLVAGCSQQPAGGVGAKTFDTPEAAIDAFVAALGRSDRAELAVLLGPGTEDVLNSGDPIADSAAVAGFLARYEAGHHFVGGDPDHLVLQVGEDDWPMPFPIVRRDGKWFLDGAAGADEILMRRIGGDELKTIDVMNGFVEAQNEYAASAHDGVPAGTYAQRLRSEAGKHDGLYWDPVEGEPESPAGPLLADATNEGYAGTAGTGLPYHGYHYKALKSQGPSAPGGAAEYVADGRQTKGFALLAWPATYGSSGVMTFMVNQDGVVWQKDLGDGTEQAAATITTFDPDTTWTPIPPEE